MPVRLVLSAVAVLMAGTPGAGRAETPTGDAERGAAHWEECSACHTLGAGAEVLVGPPLTGILGRTVGRHPGFDYSDAMLGEGAGGLVWSIAALDAYIADPHSYIPGTYMGYAGLPDATDRADLIAYIALAPAGAEGGFSVDPAILAIVGDPAYGAYLSSECAACHSDGAEGIPRIRNLPVTGFVTMMHAYRSGHRTHPVMETIAARLSDEEIAALAAYFESAQ